MASNVIKLPRATYADKARAVNYGTQATVTPERDGWLTATGSVTSAQSIAPIIRILSEGSIISEGVGLTSAGTQLNTGAPVKAGNTYTIQIYRASLYSVVLY